MTKKIPIFLIIIFSCLFNTDLYSKDEIKGEQLLDLSLEELMNLTVRTGNITGLTLSKIPVSVTTITSNEIEITPARNIYDLLEIYVPGAIFFNHYDSPHLGVRGIVVDRNYKFLLLVNGRNMNLKAHNGATSELELWDLNDIDKIEVIRGPGSVTYGPGAVAGIINIITKRHEFATGLNVRSNYCYPYSSYGLSANYSENIGEGKLNIYAGIQRTSGYENATIYAPVNYNKFIRMGSEDKIHHIPADYYADYNDLPQIKLNAEYFFNENWSAQMRYTRQGASQNPMFPKFRPQIGYDTNGYQSFGEPLNLLQTQDQHIMLNVKNSTSFENNFNLNSMISLSSESYIRRTEYFRTFPKEFAPSWDTVMMLQDVNSLWNHEYDFSESSVFGQFILNKEFNENIKIAAGTELSLNFWGPGWGNDQRMLRMGDNGDIISGKDSYIYGSRFDATGVPEGSGYFVGSGWSTFTYSLLFEALWQIDPLFSVLLSGRTDKDSYSNWLFSPRIALIAELDNNSFLKLVVQQSQRMNTAAQLLIQHLNNKSTKPETLDGIELIYSGLINDDFVINASLFYNNLDVISWYNVGRSTRPTGNLSLIGCEIESMIKIENLEVIFNQSFVKQLGWTLSDSVFFSGISYSDYYQQLNNMEFSSTGNDLSNWSNFATKFIINYKLFDDKLLLHLDSRIFWSFEGENEGVKLLEKAMDINNPDYNLIKAMLKTIEDTDTYGTDFRINISAAYNLTDNIKLTMMAMNIYGYGNNKRYNYDSGVKKTTNYFRHGFIEEPATVIFKIDYKLF